MALVKMSVIWILAVCFGFERALGASYAPTVETCPAEPLVRTASGISPAEMSYVHDRNIRAAAALNSWLSSLNAGFSSVSTASAPILGISWSGGGYRALLNGAGVLQALDIRDSHLSVSGIYQAFTYESALSGGAWFLAGVASNNYPTISNLTERYYLPNIQGGLLAPKGTFGTLPTLLEILLGEVQSKQLAGYEVTLADPYGRLLGYNLLPGPEGGISSYFSDIAHSTNFTNRDVAFPIITSIALNNTGSRCSDISDSKQAQMETTPLEFGSWDRSISAFASTKYLGTRLTAGKPALQLCTTRFDSTGFIQATSGNVLAADFCALGNALPLNIGQTVLTLVRVLKQLILRIHGITDAADSSSASYPNPFYQHPSVDPAYSSGSQLYLVDGGTTNQNNPIWPHLHRNVSVLFVADAFSNITSLYFSYTAARTAGLLKMPVIPEPAQYDNATMPRFFGCHQANTMTIIWLAGFNYVYPNNITGGELQLNSTVINGLMANGRASANGNGDSEWAVCVACATLFKSEVELPERCVPCLNKYCWN